MGEKRSPARECMGKSSISRAEDSILHAQKVFAMRDRASSIKKRIIEGNWRIILLPLSWCYGAVVAVRNLLYDQRILRSLSYDIPVISVGNITVGGTGKTPQVAYLIMLLSQYIDVAVLSKGYGRKSSGFLWVKELDAEKYGDEIVQLKQRFSHIPMAVGEDRSMAISYIIRDNPNIKCVILDDAFQHRKIKPYLNLLLTTRENPFHKDFPLPAGNNREFRIGAKRADAIIVTKNAVDGDKNEDFKRSLSRYQKPVLFSFIKYKRPYFLWNKWRRFAKEQYTELLVLTGIANAKNLTDHLATYGIPLKHMEYDDHHDYTKYDIGRILDEAKTSSRTVIVTTEKDAVRLQKFRSYFIKEKIPIFAIPIESQFYDNQFDNFIKTALADFKI